MKKYSRLYLNSVIELGHSYGLKFEKRTYRKNADLSEYTDEMIIEIQFIGEVTGSFLMVAKEMTFRKIAAQVLEVDDEPLFESFWLDFLNVSMQPALESISKEYRYLTITAPRFYHAPVKFPSFPKETEKVLWNGEAIFLHTLLDKRTLDTMQAYLQAKQANESKSRFLANMSHDIRTPLNAVLGFSQLLEQRQMDAESKSYVQKIRRSSVSLLDLINDILDLSKVEAGKLELNYGAFSLKSLFEEMDQLFSLKANNKDLEFRISISKNMPDFLLLDEARLKQVLINFLSNGFKFTDEGSVILTADWLPAIKDRKSGSLSISIQDTGIGIPEDQQSSVFSAFEQVKGQDVEKYGGTGLGLAISSRLVGMMGGRIKLRSRVGEGASFEINFPDIKTADLKMKTTQGLFNSHVDFASAKILLVDDLEINRKLLTGFLEQYSFDICEAVDGRDALLKVKQFKPDLIFLDMKMPDIDGYEVIHTLKKDDEFKGIPVIAVTASAFKEDEKLLKKICEGFIAKPLNRHDLLEQLMKYIKYREVANSEEIKVTVVNKQLIKNLLKGCEKEITPLIKNLQKNSSSVNAMIELGNGLNKIADKYPEPNFMKWKNELQEACDNYDVLRVSRLISEYDELIAKIRDQSTKAR